MSTPLRRVPSGAQLVSTTATGVRVLRPNGGPQQQQQQQGQMHGGTQQNLQNNNNNYMAVQGGAVVSRSVHHKVVVRSGSPLTPPTYTSGTPPPYPSKTPPTFASGTPTPPIYHSKTPPTSAGAAAPMQLIRVSSQHVVQQQQQQRQVTIPQRPVSSDYANRSVSTTPPPHSVDVRKGGPPVKFVETGLPLVQKLRKLVESEMYPVNKEDGKQIDFTEEHLYALRRNLEKVYMELEARASPPIALIDRLWTNTHRPLYHMMNEASNGQREQAEFDSLMDSIDWDRDVENFSLALARPVRDLSRVRKRVTCMGRPMIEQKVMNPIQAHQRFLYYYNYIRDRLAKQHSAIFTVLEDVPPFVTVIQMDIGLTPTTTTKHTDGTLHSNIVPQIRVVVWVRDGEVMELKMGSPKEELYRKRVLHDSQYAVYREMTTGLWYFLSDSNVAWYQNHHHIMFSVSVFQSYIEAFKSTCRSCGRILRDFLPPTRIVSIGKGTMFAHSSCV